MATRFSEDWAQRIRFEAEEQQVLADAIIHACREAIADASADIAHKAKLLLRMALEEESNLEAIDRAIGALMATTWNLLTTCSFKGMREAEDALIDVYSRAVQILDDEDPTDDPDYADVSEEDSLSTPKW
jgi:hypothetical protein